jgi:RNA polymerase sigma-32 factor
VAGLAGGRQREPGERARRAAGHVQPPQLLNGALSTLNERERHILIERRLKDEPTTLEELSQQYNISRERVRQIEVRAFEKLQKSMKQQIVERRLAVG